MRIDIATLFPEMCETVLSESIIGRARRKGILQFFCHNIRDYTLDKHRRVDDAPYGGGMGMVMQADPIYRCFEDVREKLGKRPHVIYLSPQGKSLTQAKAVELSKMDGLMLICGHYEGVDERVIEEIVDEEISIGDYVLTGGELPALVLADTVCRLIPGVLSDEESFTEESHYAGLLEYPQYTRPPVWHDREVPSVLFTGHHANIRKWRREQQIVRTLHKRPDMLKDAPLDKEDRKFLRLLQQKEE
ncbi:MAG TPA: tRNA (guanosine(37)-N1)-methyltransferase TrmD [Firmicutes bacterium]|nr:tRNA (guanosine(37)-N1)-methyltransferase TrmD [Bacillota bacterium]